MPARQMRIVESQPEPRRQPAARHQETSAWELGGLSKTELARRTWSDMDRHKTFSRAAELAFYFFLALFPLLFAVLSIFGMLAGQNSQLQSDLMNYMARVVPSSGQGLIAKTVQETVKSSGGWKLILGIIGALWSASSGMNAISSTLDDVYEVGERPWYKSRPIAVALTIGVAILVAISMGLVLVGSNIANMLSRSIGMGGVINMGWKIVQWPVALAILALAFAVIYYFAPNVKNQKWYWITPGSVIGVLLWIIASIGFRFYLQYFNSYSSTYGSLGAVIVLLMWFYITGLAILIGAEVNSQIEHAAAERGRADAKLKGEQEAPAA